MLKGGEAQRGLGYQGGRTTMTLDNRVFVGSSLALKESSISFSMVAKKLIKKLLHPFIPMHSRLEKKLPHALTNPPHLLISTDDLSNTTHLMSR